MASEVRTERYANCKHSLHGHLWTPTLAIVSKLLKTKNMLCSACFYWWRWRGLNSRPNELQSPFLHTYFVLASRSNPEQTKAVLAKVLCQISKTRTAHLKTYSLTNTQQFS